MLLKFFCLAVVLAKVESDDKTKVKLPNTADVFKIVLKSWYPDDAEFNKTCVSEGCPDLTNFSLCPKDINITVLHSVLDTAIGCMKKPICGIVIDNRPTPNLTFTTEDWVHGLEIDGIGTIHPGECFLSNASNIHLHLLPSHNRSYQLPIEMTMLITNMRNFGYLQMDFKLRTILPSILGQALSVTFPKIKYDGDIEYAATISFNHSLSGSNFDIKLLNPIIKIDFKFCGLEMPEGFPSVQSLITVMAKMITEKSAWAEIKSSFLEKYFKSAIDTVSEKC